MTIDRAVFIFLGCVVLLGVALSLTIHPYWIAFSPAKMVRPIQ